MNGQKLIQTFNQLSHKELNRFISFAQSPYFNKHEGVLLMAQYLSECYPKINEEAFRWPIVVNRIFRGNEKEAKKKFAPYCSYTLNLLHQFLIQEQLQLQDSTQSILSLKSLRKHHLNNLFEKVLHRHRTKVNENKASNSINYQLQYQIANEADQFYDNIGKRMKDDNLQIKQFYLDRYFLLEKLRDSCEMVMRTKILNISFSNEIMEFLLNYLQEHIEAYGDDNQILIYYKIYLMLLHSEEKDYFESLRLLEQSQENFSLPELKSIYNYLQNFCIESINEGKAAFLNEIFKLYQSQLKHDLLIEDGYLSQWHYKNIVTTGLRLEETDWVKLFIEDYKVKLKKEDRENAYKFNLASYYYTTRQYEQVLSLLLSIEYSDYRYNLGSKALLLRTYFDLEEYDPLFALVDSFRHYLLRNKLMANAMRIGYQNLFKLTRKVAHLKSNYWLMSPKKAATDLRKLIDSFQKTDVIFNKTWLEQKIKELEMTMLN